MNLRDNTASTHADFRAPGLIAQDLADHLAREIVFLNLPPNTRLIEEELGRRFAVSRSPVREVLRILENEGLVRRVPRKGIWVAPLSQADADEIYACRLSLEGLAAESAAARAHRFDRATLEQPLAELRAAADDMLTYFQANVGFTAAVRDMAGNRTLTRLLRQISRQGERYRYFAYLKEPDLIERSLAGNERIAEAILGGHTATAKAITCDLIETAWTRVRAHLTT